MTSVIAPAIWAVTSAFCRRCRGGLPGSWLRNAVVASAFDATSAGTLPPSATTMRPPRNATITDIRSRPTSSILGSTTTPAATTRRTNPQASNRPSGAGHGPQADGLGQELPDQSRSARAQGGANRELAAPAGGARGHQATGVRARDREQREHRAEPEPQTAPRSRADDVIEEAGHANVEVLILRVGLAQARRDQRHLRSRVVRADARRHPAQDLEAVAVANPLGGLPPPAQDRQRPPESRVGGRELK